MDKTKQPPIPPKTAEQKPAPSTPQPRQASQEPQFVRGTVDPTVKK